MTDDRPEILIARFSSDLETWNRFAAVNSEFVDIHMDDAIGRAAGMESAIAMGNLQVSYVVAAVHRWWHGSVSIDELDIRFVSPLIRRTELTLRAERITSDSPEHDRRFAFRIVDQRGSLLVDGTFSTARS